MPKFIDHEKRRQNLMLESIERCYKAGFSGIAIGEIADGIGISRTLFYQYFPDKPSLIDAALDFALEVTGSDYRHLCDDIFMSGAQKIETLFTGVLLDVVREQKTIRVLLDVLMQREHVFYRQRLRVYHWLHEIRQLLRTLLRSGIRNGDICPLDIPAMSTTLLLLLISLMNALSSSEQPNGTKLVQSVGRLLCGLIPEENSSGFGAQAI